MIKSDKTIELLTSFIYGTCFGVILGYLIKTLFG
jgi:F0F1-type ATP synthase assembly protein I